MLSRQISVAGNMPPAIKYFFHNRLHHSISGKTEFPLQRAITVIFAAINGKNKLYRLYTHILPQRAWGRRQQTFYA